MPVEMTSGLPVAASRCNQAVIGDVAAGDLVGVDPELLERRHHVLGERRRHHRQAVRRARVDDRAVRVEVELERREEVAQRRGPDVRRRRTRRRHEPIGVERLQLDGAGAGRGGRVDQRDARRQRPAVVQPDLGDHEHRRVGPTRRPPISRSIGQPVLHEAAGRRSRYVAERR